MTIGARHNGAAGSTPATATTIQRQRQQRQPQTFIDNLTTPPAQRHHGPQGPRRRARLIDAPATATAAAGAVRTATAARTTRNPSRPRQRQPRAARKGHARSTDRPTPATPPQGPQTGRQRAPRNAAKVQYQPQPTTPPAATEKATAGKVCTKASRTAARRATLDTSQNRQRGDGSASLAKTQGANGPHRTKAGRIPNGRRPAGVVPGLNDLNGCAPNT